MMQDLMSRIKNNNLIIFSIVIILILIIVIMIKYVKKYKLSQDSNIDNKLYYFDNNATTFIHDPSVLKEIDDWVNCGNPSNVLHKAGIRAKAKLDESRKSIADDLGVDTSEIIFTGNATEANNIIIQGTVNKYLQENPIGRYSMITSNFEHPSVIKVFDHYAKYKNINVIKIPIRTDINDPYYGSIDPKDVEDAIQKGKNFGKVIILSIMYANNETGAVQNIAEIGRIARDNGVFFHSDFTQGIGKYVIKPKELNVNAASFSAHKFHGPKGLGCLYMDNKCGVDGLCYGGEQENEHRPGTENVAFIAATAVALRLAHTDRERRTILLNNKRKYLKDKLESLNIECIEPRYAVLPNTLLVIIKDLKGCNKMLATDLSKEKNICVGVSSACQTKVSSHVLDAMNIPKEYRTKIIRISMSDYTTQQECDYLVKSIAELIEKYKRSNQNNTE